MTEDQKYELATLVDDYNAKKLRYESLGMLNTYGLTPEERTKQSIEYHMADAEFRQAWAALERAKNAIASTPPRS